MKIQTEKRVSRYHAFTLIELLVVITIILILAAMLLGVFSEVRSRGKMTSCRNNLGQMGLALAMYRGDFNERMPGWLSNLVPDYGVQQDLLICPQDYSAGRDGGRPAGDDERAYAYNEVVDHDSSYKDMYGPEDYNIPAIDSGSIPYEVMDEFRETDDITENNAAKSPATVTPRNQAINSCSYMYEFAGVECSWGYHDYSADDKPNDRFLAQDAPSGWTWNQVKESQLRYGNHKLIDTPSGYKVKTPVEVETFTYDRFPSTRCFYHYGKVMGNKDYVVNAAYEGSTFIGPYHWEDGAYE